MHTAQRVTYFRESVIREMTRLAMDYDAINLSQGYPDFDTPLPLKEAAVNAIREGNNQYSFTWGYLPLREKLAERYTSLLGWTVDPAEHVTVTCGVTEAINVAMLAVSNPGDDVLLIEPGHENFIPAIILAGARPVAVPLEHPEYRLDFERLSACITPRTCALLLNTPHNPTGRVFDAKEIDIVANLAQQHDIVLITDEIYDRILYDGRHHLSPGGFEQLRERTITIGGFSKTYAITGWRLGYMVAPTQLMRAIRPVHDFLTICAPTPLQIAAVMALSFPQDYYDGILSDYHQRRDVMVEILKDLGFTMTVPEGAYYILADYSRMEIPQAQWDSRSFAEWMVREYRVAVVPGSVFYSLPGYGEHCMRFSFSKKVETLLDAGERMRRIKPL
ncbi:MAG: pyridoxal phosphate-dependent aminotransferase [Chloroflexota bacterium]|nr:pyridoxal phosphate-dependent aminotransferase [Chloroflexota bacterium]